MMRLVYVFVLDFQIASQQRRLVTRILAAPSVTTAAFCWEYLDLLFYGAIVILTLLLQVSYRNQLFLLNGGLLLQVVICLFQLCLSLGLGLLNWADKIEKLIRILICYTYKPCILAVLQESVHIDRGERGFWIITQHILLDHQIAWLGLVNKLRILFKCRYAILQFRDCIALKLS